MKKTFVLASAIVLAMFILSGCIIGGPKDEKQAFIDATIESTCLIFQQGDAFDPELETKVKDIFAKYDFKVDDNVAMEELSKKYVDDEEVGKAIMDGVTKCSQGVTGLTPPAAIEEEAPAAEAPATEEETPVAETTPEATETPAAEVTPEAPAAEVPAAE